jgi:hypothetical protein
MKNKNKKTVEDENNELPKSIKPKFEFKPKLTFIKQF